jgi:predicted TIM-barrel fold metal-dependent hydrolase
MGRVSWLTILAACVCIAPAAAQDRADPALLAEIGRIRAIDHHSHADPASPPGDEPTQPVGAPPFEYPFRLRAGNPEYAEAWRALWGESSAGPGADQQAVLRAKWRTRKERADGYPSWVLDQAGIDVVLVSAERLGPGQAAPRFRWVAQGDELLFPLGNERPRFRRMLADCGLSGPPATLAEYVARVLTPTLERWKASGALAVKLAVAYRRSLDFAAAAREDAERVYARSIAGTAPTADEYKTLQDYLFRLLAGEAGRTGLVLHIHTGVGADPYFNLSGSRPALLEPALNDPALRKTRVVFVHGGWPYDRETGVLLMKPSVYADFSAQPFLRSTRALAETLRAWLEWYPEKVMFGTDAYSEGPMGITGWEEKAWLAARTSREALALALTGMMADSEITRGQAVELARLVLRGNAERLYGLGSQ